MGRPLTTVALTEDGRRAPIRKTEFRLLALYEGKIAIPVEDVCRDFFPHLGVTKFLRKVGDGSIDLPIMRMDRSLKTTKMVHIDHLAAYLDRMTEAAEKEARQLNRAG